jgi:integrase
LTTRWWLFNLIHEPVESDKTTTGGCLPKKKEIKRERGIFERPAGSGVWWIVYYVNGVRHREKVGRRSDALNLYKTRKADAWRGIKLPELKRPDVVTFGELALEAEKYAKAHLRTPEDYTCKVKVLAEPFGTRPAIEITPNEIRDYLRGRIEREKDPWTPATANRYKAFMSTAYRLGMENSKVSVNPARLVKSFTENNVRERFLSREEFKKLLKIIRRDNPKQAPSLIVAAYSAMRWSEQFNLTWSQVDFKRKLITRVATKTSSVKPRYRDVPLNSISIAALQEQKKMDAPNTKSDDTVFPKDGPYADWDWWLKPALKEAKIEDVVWHSLRHTCLSWAAMSGATMKEIQGLGGHLTISQAARYMHLSPSHQSTASERMAQWESTGSD